MEGLWRQDRNRSQSAEACVRRLRVMHAPLTDREDRSKAATGIKLLAAFESALAFVKQMIAVLAVVALSAACAIPIYSGIIRASVLAVNYWAERATALMRRGATVA